MPGIEHVVRQVEATVFDTVLQHLEARNLGNPTTTASPTSTPPTDSTSSPSASVSSTNPPGSPNSPLLFFVALGFGVVFTNLWYVASCLDYGVTQN
jgi:hypothetical protein